MSEEKNKMADALKNLALVELKQKLPLELRRNEKFVEFITMYFANQDYRPIIAEFEKLDIPPETKGRLTARAKAEFSVYGDRDFDPLRETNILKDTEEYYFRVKAHVPSPLKEKLLKAIKNMEKRICKIEPYIQRETFQFNRLRIYYGVYVYLYITVPGEYFTDCNPVIPKPWEHSVDGVPEPVSTIIASVETQRYAIKCRVDAEAMYEQFFKSAPFAFFYERNWQWLENR